MAGLAICELTTYRWSFEEDVQHYAAAGIEGILNFAPVTIAVPKHINLVRISRQLSVEIHNMTMGVSLAEDRNKTKDVALKSKALAVGLDHPFGCQF